MMTAFVVDDEKLVRENVVGALKRYCAMVEVVGQANNIKEATDRIGKMQPNLLFLDVEVGNDLVFQLLEQLDYQPLLVFITGHEKYALRALKAEAVDYLIKPIVPKDLVAAVAKARAKLQQQQLLKQLQLLINDSHHSRLSIPGKDKYRVTKTEDLVYCQADNNYTHFYLKSGDKVVASKTLKSFEGQLLACGFFRVHQSFLVNLAWVTHFDKKQNCLLLANDTTLPVAQRRRADLVRALDAST